VKATSIYTGSKILHFLPPPCKILGRDGRNVWVNFMSLAYNRTCGIHLTGRLTIIWQIRARVSKNERGLLTIVGDALNKPVDWLIIWLIATTTLHLYSPVQCVWYILYGHVQQQQHACAWSPQCAYLLQLATITPTANQ